MKVSKKPNTNKASVGKAKPINAKFDLQAAARSVDSVLTQQTLDWVEHAVDPKNHPPAPRPVGANVYNGHVEVPDLKCTSTLFIGTGGVGFAVIDPCNAANCTDRLLGLATQASAVTTLSSSLLFSATAGLTSLYPSRTGVTGAGLGTGNYGQDYLTAVNACGVYIKPKGSATTQDGMIYILEVPGHPVQNLVAGMTIQSVIDHERTRSIPGNQVGTPGFENVLNWHPQPPSSGPSPGYAMRDDSAYSPPQAATTSLEFAPLIVVVTGTAGASYSLEIYGSYLARGRLAKAVVPNYADILGMQAYFNMILLKRISGWMGKASDAVSAYRIALGLAHSKSLPKERRKKDKEKAKEETDSGPWSLIHRAAEFAKPLLREFVGI